MSNILSLRKIISYTSIGIFLLITVVFLSSYIPLRKEKATVDKIYMLMSLLYFEKLDTGGEYPYDLECFKDNPFDDENILLDSWGNPFYYELFDDSKKYLLLSSGKDGVLFTEDDIDSYPYKFLYRDK